MPKTHHRMTTKRWETLCTIIRHADMARRHQGRPIVWDALTLVQKAAVRGLVKLGYVIVNAGIIFPTKTGRKACGLVTSPC